MSALPYNLRMIVVEDGVFDRGQASIGINSRICKPSMPTSFLRNK